MSVNPNWVEGGARARSARFLGCVFGFCLVLVGFVWIFGRASHFLLSASDQICPEGL
jgi:hypothetical protein